MSGREEVGASTETDDSQDNHEIGCAESADSETMFRAC